MSGISYEDVEQILAILRDADFEHFELELGDFRLVASRGANLPATRDENAVRQSSPPQSGEVEPASSTGASNAGDGARQRQSPASSRTITAPMVGIFYIAPQPGAPPFVEVGQEVGVGDTVGMIEAMKMFTAVTAGIAGRIEERLVDNDEFVEFAQPLFVLDGGTSPGEPQ